MAIDRSLQDNEVNKFVESASTPGVPAVRVVNPDGSNISGGGGGGAGTEYTEDTAAAANPVGPMTIARRKDTLATNEVSDDGDNIAVNATSKGELHVKHSDSIAVTHDALTELAAAINTNKVDVNIVSGSSSGTQYTEGDTDTTITGTALMFESDTGTSTVSVVSNSNPLPISDAGGAITVDGTVSVTGVATAANQTTIIGHVDGLEGLLTTIDADTSSLADAVSGTEVQVDIVASLPSGTNAIGKLAANSGVDIGDVDILSIAAGDNNIGNVDLASAIPAGTNNIGDVDVFSNTVKDGSGTRYQPIVDTDGHLQVDVLSGGGGGTQYTEDAASSGGETLTLAGAIRQDTLASSTSADGDFANLKTDSTGALYSNAKEHAITGSGSVTSATNLFSLDLLGYSSVSVQVTSAGTSCTITYEHSNDNSTWVAVPMDLLTSNTTTPATTSTTTGLRGCALSARYFRARVSTYGSGTVSATYVATAGTYLPTAVSANLAGQTLANVTTVATVTNITNQGHLADNAGFTDGTTRVMMNGYIFDEVAGTALTENDAAAARIDSKRAVVSVIEDETTRGRRATVTAANALKVDASGVAVPITDNSGSLTVDNAGTFAVQVDGSALTALQLIDDTVFTDDAAFTAATSKVQAMGGIVTSDAVDAGDVGAFAMLANRQQKVTLYDSSGVELSVGGGTQYDEDAVHSSGAKVTLAGVVRQDTATQLAGTDGDYSALINDASGRLHVNVGTSALPTGAATAANQTTIIGHVDGIEGLLTTIDADTSTLSAAVAGTEMQVDVVASLPAGTNAIGKLAANSGVDIGDVDILSVIPGTGATNLGKAEDAAHSSGDTGVMMLGVRNDTASSLSGTDGDYTPLTTNDIGGLYTTYPTRTSSGTVSALNGTVSISCQGASLISGYFDGTGDANYFIFEGTLNGSEWFDIQAVIDNSYVSYSYSVDNGNVYFYLPTNGMSSFRVKCNSYDTGSVNVTLKASDGVPIPLLATSGGDIDYGLDVDVTRLPSLPAGSNAIGKLAANSGVDIGDVDVTSISAGTNNIGNVGIIGRTSGGMSIFRSIDIDETEEDVKTSAGQVFSISAFNRTAAPIYLKFYNATAASVVVGTTTPVLTFVVPGNADSDGAGFVWNNDLGFAFGTAICVAATTGVADNDTGAPGANDCVVNIGYV